MEIKSSTVWDILSILVLAAAAGVLVLYGVIFFFPNNALNMFPPQAPPAVVILPSPTNTLVKLPPTNTVPADLFATATIRATETLTPTLTATAPTLTPSLTQTVSLTPTITGTAPTETRTPTNTQNPIVLTNSAKTAIAQAQTANAVLTSQAKTSAVLQLTRNVQNTQTAQARLTSTALVRTQTAQVLTQTQGAIETATAQVMTATQNAVNTATAISITQTRIATITMVAQATVTAQAQIVNSYPIAYSDTGGDAFAERFVSRNMIGSSPISLNMSGYPQAAPASGWWLSEEDNHFLLFTYPAINPIYRVLYTTIATVDGVNTGGFSQNIMQPSINKQDGLDSARSIVFTLAAGGATNYRNLWTVQAAPGANGAQPVVQISSDNTRDDHDPSWVISQTSPYNGNIVFVSSQNGGPENIYMMSIANGYTSAIQLTFYEIGNQQINSPRWCSGYDWENEEFYNQIVYSFRTGPSDEWNLYTIDPDEQIVIRNNNPIHQLTFTDGTNELQPDWSPFCNRITYLAGSGSNWDVWTMANDGTDKVNLTNDGSATIEAWPLWKPYK